MENTWITLVGGNRVDGDENKSVSWEQGEEIELGKGIQEETVGMEQYLRGDMET